MPPERLWRLTIAGAGLVGVWLAARQYDVWWTALSQLASLGVGVVYLTLATCPRLATGRLLTASSWLRGALATLMVLIAAAFAVMQHGNAFDPYSVLEHMITPALVVADYVTGRSRPAEPRWWHPLSWTVLPTAYLVYYVAADLDVYTPLDPSRPAQFSADLTVLLGVFLLAGSGLAATARRPTAVTAFLTAEAGPQGTRLLPHLGDT